MNPTAVAAKPRARGGRGGGRNAGLDGYFDAMGAVPLLDAAEEVRLAQAFERGREAAARLDAEPGPPAEERPQLQALVEEGMQARDRFVTANLRLVVALAARQARQSDIGLDDLIQDGNLGLLAAVDRFDWRRGYRFSTYATWWIRQALQRGTAADDRVLKLPYSLHDALRKVRAARTRLEAETGTEPSVARLAEATRLPEATVRRALAVPPDAVSLDQPAGDDPDAGDLGGLLAVAEDDPAEEVAERLTRSAQVGAAAAAMNERDWQLLRLRYGLDGSAPRTYDAIGAELSVCRETVRISLNRALNTLRRELAG